MRAEIEAILIINVILDHCPACGAQGIEKSPLDRACKGCGKTWNDCTRAASQSGIAEEIKNLGFEKESLVIKNLRPAYYRELLQNYLDISPSVA